MYNSHIYFFGILIFLSAMLTGIGLILGYDIKVFAGCLIISYTMLQTVVGIERNERERDEREDF